MKNSLSVFYDGACPLCRREINHYRQKDHQNIEYIDISTNDFVAKNYGLDASQVQKKMHVKEGDGTIHTGVEAFLALWRFFPEYSLLRKLISFPLIKPLAKLGYICFAKLRPHLPGRKENCDDDVCKK